VIATARASLAADDYRLAACAPQRSAATACFPCHEIVERLSGSISDKFDHRGVIDGALGAEYLKELRHLLENPALLMV